MNYEQSTEKIWLWQGKAPGSDIDDGFRPTLELYTVETDKPRGAVLICPGGGYCNRAPHEGKPVAEKFNEAGFHAFVVQYRVAHRHPAPLLDASRALRIIRHRSDDWNVNPDQIAICGFSAGGHLAGSLGVHFDNKSLESENPIDRLSCRPNALILCYPVITSGENTHSGSIQNLLGRNASDDLFRKMSLELQVTDRTPPAFLWHTFEDTGVPLENSILFAQALRKHSIPFELHIYPKGAHGLGLAEGDAHVATWMNLCCQWLRNMGWNE